MSQPTRDQHLGFSVTYAMYHQQLAARLYSRIDKLISFLILLCGMAVVSQLLPPVLTGFIVTVLGCWQLVYLPSSRAASAAEQYLRYERLFERFSQLTADEIERKLIKIRRRDGQVPRALDYPAFNLALEKLGGCEAEKCKLTKWQKLVYGFCS